MIPLVCYNTFLTREQELFPHCFVMVGSRNRIELDLQEQKCVFHNWT